MAGKYSIDDAKKDYRKQKQESPKKITFDGESSKSQSKSSGSGAKKLKRFELAPLPFETTQKSTEIAPLSARILNRLTIEDSNGRSWLEKGLLGDGVDEGDIAKTILATGADIRENMWSGAFGIVEEIADAAAGIAPLILGTDRDKAASFVMDDLYDEKAEVKKALAKSKGIQELYAQGEIYGDIAPVDIARAKAIIEEDYSYRTKRLDAESISGEKIDSLAQSAGQAMARKMFGKEFLQKGAQFLSAYGSQFESALKDGASYEQASASAAVSGTAEVVFEMISGSVKYGGSSLDDAMTKKLSRDISNAFLRNGAKLSLDMVGEGLEEILTEGTSKFGEWIAYKKSRGESWQDVLLSKQSRDELIESFFSGMLMGGAFDAASAVSAKATGVDFTSGLTKNEETVVNKLYKDRVAKAELEGKLSGEEKNKIYDEVIEAMDRGDISTDTIEELLGGNDYRTYKQAMDSKEDNDLISEHAQLKDKKGATPAETTRYQEIDGRVSEIQKNRADLKKRLEGGVSEFVKSDRLAESYAQKAERGRAFNVDLNKVNEKQRKIYQKAMESGVVNNTRKAHEFVDLVARIASDKGIDFDFANNEKIKASGFAVEGARVNGYKTKDGITINMQSTKALNTVVGHEVTHVLEGTDLYKHLQDVCFDYAKSKGEFDARLKNTKALYKNLSDDEINMEITADLVGEYLFTDPDFIKNLYSGNRNVFEKIYDEIKYLCKVVTAGSKEARQLEKVKKAFADAYHAETKTVDRTAYHVSKAFSDSVDAVLNKEYPSGNQVMARDFTPKILVDHGVSDLPMLITQKHVRSVVLSAAEAKAHGFAVNHTTNYHGLGKDALIKAIDGMDDPSAVYKTGDGEYLVITQISDTEGRPIVVPVKIDGRGSYNDVYIDENQIKSVYGRKNLDSYLSRNNFEEVYKKSGITLNERIQYPNISDSTNDSISDISEKSSDPDALAKEKLSEINIEIDTESSTVSHSLSSLEDSFGITDSDYLLDNTSNADFVQARAEYVDALARSIALDKDEPTEEERQKAERYMDSLFLIHDMILDDRDRLDYEAAVNKSAWVSNAEYGGSIDFSTLCAKRRLFTGTFDAIQNALPDTVLDENDFLKIRQMLLEADLESPCSMCYVEGSRAKHGVYVERFLKDYLKTNPEWKPQIADFTSTTRLEQTRIQHPEAYAAYQAAMNKLSQRKPKEASVRTDYKGEILRDFKDSSNVEEKNKNGGVRFNSFSDFEVIHALDCMQVLMDMSRVGLNGQAYTKVKEFAEAFGNTGLKINLSLVAKDVDADGKLIMDETNGMKYDEAMDLRSRYSENVGSVIVVFNEAQLKAALADPSIDYVLPFHRSQWKKSQYTMMGLPAQTKDFTNFQNDRIKNPKTGRDVKLSKIKHVSTFTNDAGESFDITENIMPNQYWNFDLSGRQNAETYLKYINDNGMTPKFSFLLSKDADGKWVLPNDAVGDGYFKLLIDFKMYNNDGWGSPQNPVVPDFNMDFIQQMLENYKGGHNAFPVAHDVVNKFVEGRKVKYSLSETEIAPLRDEYFDSDGTQLSKEQAEYFADSKVRDENGKLLKLYHGTQNFGFTIVDTSKSDDGISFFMTDNPAMAQSYSGTSTVQSVVDSKETTWFDPMFAPIEEVISEYNLRSDRNIKMLSSADEINGWADRKKEWWRKEISRFNDMVSALLPALESDYSADPVEAARLSEFKDFLAPYREAYALAGNAKTADELHEASELLMAVKNAESKNKAIRNNIYYMVFSPALSPVHISQDLGQVSLAMRALEGGSPLLVDGNKYVVDEENIRDELYYLFQEEKANRIALGNYPLYANLTNPLVVDAKGSNWNRIHISENIREAFRAMDGNTNMYRSSTRQFSRFAKENGYDGVIFKNVVDYGAESDFDEEPATVVIAFESNQVKDAENRNPTENVDMRYSLDAEGAAPVRGNSRDIMSEDVYYDPTDIAPVAAKPRVKTDGSSSNISGTDEEKDEILSPKDRAKKYFFDEVMSLDKMPEGFRKKHGEKWVRLQKATENAQDLVVNGADGVKPLDDIFNRVVQTGAFSRFELYMQHMRNMDSMSLEQRFGVKNKPVLPDYTSEMSRQEALKLEAEYPEFKEIAEDIYAYNRFLRNVLVKSGKISQETADLWEQRYPHYIPIRRAGFANDFEVSELLSFMVENMEQVPEAENMDGFFKQVEETAPVKKAKGSDLPIYPLFDTLTERAMQTYWAAAMTGADVDAFAPVRSDIPKKTTSAAPKAKTDIPEAVKIEVEKSSDPKILDVDNEIMRKGKMNPAKWVEEFVLDNGMVFERLAKKVKDRALEAKWNFVRNARGSAQHLIGNGDNSKGVAALKDIFEAVKLTKATEQFYEYLGHQRNLDSMTMRTRFGLPVNHTVMGRSLADSVDALHRLDQEHPEFKALADKTYKYSQNLLDLMVESGMVTQTDADTIREISPHWIPFNTVDGKIQPVFQTLAQETLKIHHAMALNNFGVHLKNTLGTVVSEKQMHLDDFMKSIERGGDIVRFGGNPRYHTMTVLENGKSVTFEITDEMYVAMKPTRDLLSLSVPVLSHVSTARRNLITAYSPWFTLKNAVRDIQEVILNSQHPVKTYATIPQAIKEMKQKGELYQEYVAHGGEQNTYFDPDSGDFGAGKGLMNALETKTGLKHILKANNYVEMLPRFAEYIASREAGASIEVAMLDAARVTTNFAAGGRATKFLNRNGATFLNSSVQGVLQQARNFAEAKQNGITGWASLAARYIALGLPAVLLNNLIWEDDEEYQDLPDYITNNYYILWKYGESSFFRLPKGRTAAVIQNAMRQISDMNKGENFDWKEFGKLVMENIAPNNPLEDNILAPVIQVARNKTWYDEDLVPMRLQKLPVTERFDEKTSRWATKLSQKIEDSWLGDHVDLSPKQLHYLIDQYSGVLGDTILPFTTPKAEINSNFFPDKAFAPVKDIFTTDSVLNNRVTGDFYDTLEAVEKQAESPEASRADKLKSSILIGYNAEISKLLQQQRDLQNSKEKDTVKFEKNRELKEQINALQKKALAEYNKVKITGVYAEAAGKRYNYGLDDENGQYRWYEIKPKNADGSDNWYYQNEQEVTKTFGVSPAEFWNNREEYSAAYRVANHFDEPYFETVKNVLGLETFAEYAVGLSQIYADKDSKGNSISGSRKRKVREYIYGLDIPDIEKHILYKAEYNYANKGYNKTIRKYVESLDISSSAKSLVLAELGLG